MAGESAWGVTPWVALVLGLLLLWRARRWKNGKVWGLLFAAAVFASVPLFLPYLSYAHDLDFHLCRILGMEASLKNGMFPVRLDSFTFNGFGYGQMIFYPSLFLYLPALLMVAGMPLADAVHVWLFLCNLAAAAAMYVSASRLFGSRRIGCVAAMLYTLGIYRLGNVYTRAAYGELLAMIFFPLVIWGFYEVFFQDAGKWPLLSLAMTGIIQSHIISTLLAAVGCTVAGVFCLRRLKERKRLFSVLAAAGLALLLNLWFLVPLLDYMRLGVNLEALQFPAEIYALPPVKLLELYPIALGATPVTFYSLKDTMALGLGFPVILAAGLFAWQELSGGKEGKRLSVAADSSCRQELSRRQGLSRLQELSRREWGRAGESAGGPETPGGKAERGCRPPMAAIRRRKLSGRRGIARVFLLAGICLALCATTLFPWKWLMQTGWFSVLGSYVQFPWRLVGVSLCFLCLAGAYGVCRQWSGRGGDYAAVGVLVFCLVFSQHLLDGFAQGDALYWDETEISSMLDKEEYLYPGTVRELAEGSELPAGDGIRITESRKEGLSVTFSYESDRPGEIRYADLPLFYYPGYQAEESGSGAVAVTRSEEGLVRVVFAAGAEGDIHVWFQERRLWRLSEWISLGTAVLLAAGLAWKRRRKRAKLRL